MWYMALVTMLPHSAVKIMAQAVRKILSCRSIEALRSFSGHKMDRAVLKRYRNEATIEDLLQKKALCLDIERPIDNIYHGGVIINVGGLVEWQNLLQKLLQLQI